MEIGDLTFFFPVHSFLFFQQRFIFVPMNQHVLIFACMHASWCSAYIVSEGKLDRQPLPLWLNGQKTTRKRHMSLIPFFLSVSLPLNSCISAFPDCSTSSSHKVSPCRVFYWVFPSYSFSHLCICLLSWRLHALLTIFLQHAIAVFIFIQAVLLHTAHRYQWRSLEVLFSP